MSMLYLVVCVVAVVTGVIIATNVASIRKLKPYTSLWDRWIYYLIWIPLILLSFGSPLFFEYSTSYGNGDSTSVYSFNEKKLIEHPWGMFCWEFSNDYFNIPFSKKTIRSWVSPLTQNPKVRPISYSVTPEIVDVGLFHEKYPEKDSNKAQGILFKKTMYWLLEFNEANSKKIAVFYNYLDEDQQARFKKLGEDWVNLKLAEDGIAVSFNNFSVGS